jgi:hypothetical protein
MKKLHHLQAVLLVVACTITAHRAYSTDQKSAAGFGQPPRHWSPEDLWRGIDVEKMPLEVEVAKRWEEDGCAYEKLTYVSEVVEGVKIRIFGIFGAPKGASHVPGILHIHGGGQTASLAWVQYWAKRGYASATYDFCGKWEHRTEYTDWGRSRRTATWPLAECTKSIPRRACPVGSTGRWPDGVR